MWDDDSEKFNENSEQKHREHTEEEKSIHWICVVVIIKMNSNLLNTELEWEISHTSNPPLQIAYLPPNVLDDDDDDDEEDDDFHPTIPIDPQN